MHRDLRSIAAGIVIGVAALMAAGRLTAQTQPPPTLPPTAEPTPRRDELEVPEERREAPELELERRPDRPDAAVDAGPSFQLVDLVLVGNTVFEAAELRPLFADEIGRTITLAALYDIAGRIEAYHRDAGYILTRVIVPAQSVADGRFQVQVIEGFVSEVEVQGRPRRAERLIRTYLNRLVDIRPINARDIERALLLINDIPGVTARGFLRPAGAQVGSAQLVVDVTSSRFDGFGLVDNYGSRFSGPFGAAVGAQINGLTPFGDQTEVIFFSTVDAQEQRTAQITYRQQVWRDLTGFVRATYSDAEPQFTLADLDVQTRSIAVRAGLRYPVVRSRRTDLFVEGGIEITEAESDVLGAPFTDDSLRVIYAAADAGYDDGLGGANAARLEVRRGLDLFGATDADSLLVSRIGASGAFTSVSGEVSRAQSLPAGFSLFAVVGGQYAADPVLANEEFALGSASFGRGYDPSEITGRHGVGGAVELRYAGQTPWRWFERYELFGFVDYGAVWIDDGGDLVSQDLASVGGGVRLTPVSRLAVDMSVAHRLVQDLPTREDEGDALRVYFRVIGRF